MTRRFLPATAMAVPLALAAVVLAACGSDGPDGLRIEVVDGVPHTVADNVPEWGGAALELLWEAPPDHEVLDGATWANPTQLAANERGVAVLDPVIHRIHLFASDGAREEGLGRRGEGPGELAGPAGLALHGDTIIVHDPRRPTLQLFGRDGSYIGGFAPVDGPGLGFHDLQGAGVLRSVMAAAAGQLTQTWVHTGFDGGTRPIEFPGDHSLQPGVTEGAPGCWRRGGAGSHILEVDCTFPLLRVVSVEGEVLRVHRIDRAPTQSPPEALAAVEARVRRQMGQMPAAPPAALVQTMVDQQIERNRWAPSIRLALGDPSGDRLVIWEQLPTDFGPHDAVLHLLDGQGRYLLRQEMGAPLQAIAVAPARIYVLVSDPDTDLRRLRAYRMP